MTYKYTCPTERGYERFKISRKTHNLIRTKRKVNVLSKIEAYYSEDKIIIEYSANILAKLFIKLLLPFTFIIFGLKSTKEILSDYRSLFNQKKKGSYSADHISSTTYLGNPNEVFNKLESVFQGSNRKK